MLLAAWALSEEGTPLPRHPDARLTPRGRALPCERVGGGVRVSDATAMADAGPACRSGGLGAPPGARGMGHGHARPLGPWQNGKAGRVNRTLAREWQYARAWESEDGRASALASFIEHYNWDRPHSACGGLLPMSRIVGVNIVLAHNT